MSRSPSNFFAYFSAATLVSRERMAWKHRLTESSLIYLLSCEGEDRQKFDHDLDEYIGHRRGRRNLGVDLETSEKIFETFEDVHQGFVARPHKFSRLTDPEIRSRFEQRGRHIRREGPRCHTKLPLLVDTPSRTAFEYGGNKRRQSVGADLRHQRSLAPPYWRRESVCHRRLA